MLEFLAEMQNSGNNLPSRILTDAQISGVIAQCGCLVVVMVLVSLGAGIFLDRTFHTRPLLTLLLVLGSVPVTLFLLFRIAMRATSADRQGTGRAEKDRNDRHDEA